MFKLTESRRKPPADSAVHCGPFIGPGADDEPLLRRSSLRPNDPGNQVQEPEAHEGKAEQRKVCRENIGN